MKKSVHELLEGLSPAELNDWLNSIEADTADDAAALRIAALAAEKAGIQHKRRRIPRRLPYVAALAVILMLALVGCYAADEAQYRRASEFFDLNHLSTEGLDRVEIKRVYRDITTESFIYGKTAEVIGNSAAYTVQGVAFNLSGMNATNTGWAQRMLNDEEENPAYDAEKLWNIGSSGKAADADGNTAEIKTSEWQSSSDERYLIYLLTDPSGHLLARKQTRMDDLLSVGRVAPAQDGWLAEVRLRGADLPVGVYKTALLRLSAGGEVLMRYAYDDNGGYASLESIAESDGRIFLSATVRPKESKLYSDLENVTHDVYPEHPYSDEWRDRAREEFSAALLVIDAGSGEPGQFYSVGGAFGGALGTDADGHLTWSVGRIVAAGWSPGTSSFSIFGVTRRYDYSFDSAKNLLLQERTDEINCFRTH